MDPLLRKKIESLVPEANKFNMNVLTNLGKTVKRGKVRFKTSSTLSCNRCSQVAQSISKLHEHMQNSHELSTSSMVESAKFQSTRNNSNVESLMIEDISANVLLDEDLEKMEVKPLVTVLDEASGEDEKVNKISADLFECDVWYKDNSPCVYKSPTADLMFKHTEKGHVIREEKEEGVQELNGNNKSNGDVRKNPDSLNKECEKSAPQDPEVEDLLSCNLCEFDTEILTEWVNHMKRIHNMNKPTLPTEMKSKVKKNEQDEVLIVKEVASLTFAASIKEEEPELPESVAVCGICSSGFPTEKACLDHQVIHTAPQSFPCGDCECMFENEVDLEWHTETTHDMVENPEPFPCCKCHFKALNKNELDAHMQSNHMNLKVILDIKEVTVIECDQCDFTSRLNIQMKKHKTAKHQDSKYNCKECSYTTDYVANTWEHTVDKHPDKSLEFSPKEAENFIMKLVAEQNADIIDHVVNLSKDIKGAFEHLADVVESTVGTLKVDTDDKCKTLAETVVLLHGKISQLESIHKRAKSKHEKRKAQSDHNSKSNMTEHEPSPSSFPGAPKQPPSSDN